MPSLGIVKPKQAYRLMAKEQRGKNDDEVNIELYELVRDGNGTPEQVDRVRAALRDKKSLLWQSLGESGPWAQLAIERKYRTVEEGNRLVEKITPISQQNFNRVTDYLRRKREAGVLTEQEVNAVVKSLDAEHLDDPRPTAAHYAMCVSRMIKAIIKLHPELTAEVRALPLSRKK
jgi:predicted Zn-dependent peptidase